MKHIIIVKHLTVYVKQIADLSLNERIDNIRLNAPILKDFIKSKGVNGYQSVVLSLMCTIIIA